MAINYQIPLSTALASLGEHAITVTNTGSDYALVQYYPADWYTVSDRVVHLAPLESKVVTFTVLATGDREITSAEAFSATEFPGTAGSHYSPHTLGQNTRLIPVDPTLHTAYLARGASIINQAKATVAAGVLGTSGGTIYTPGGPYSYAGLFSRDFLYMLEGAGYDFATAADVRFAVEYNTIGQATVPFTPWNDVAPAGSIHDHISPVGQTSWTPGWNYGMFNRPSLDNHFCISSVAWYAGHKSAWDSGWLAWFTGGISAKLELAYSAVPFNATSGLHRQWPTGGACTSWGFLDSELLRGDIPGLSVLAYNACNALADMFAHAGNTAKETEWLAKAAALKAAIQAVFRTGTKLLNGVSTPYGYLTWTVNGNSTDFFSPDITGYAAWSGILTDEQKAAASDWFAALYQADLTAVNGQGQIYCLHAGVRGAVREAARMDDVSPGVHVWSEYFDQGYGYNAYQDGGYWYYNAGWVYSTLWYRHPDLAAELLGQCLTDIMADTSGDSPWENIAFQVPETSKINKLYMASAAPLYGMGIPATVTTLQVLETRFRKPNGSPAGTLKKLDGSPAGILKRI